MTRHRDSLPPGWQPALWLDLARLTGCQNTTRAHARAQEDS